MASGSGISASFTIRTYRDADLPAVVALVREFQHHLNGFFDRNKAPEAMGPWYVETLLKSVRGCDGALLVAEAEGEVIAYASLLTQCTSADVPDEVLYSFATLQDLAVRSAWRGRGVGQAMIAECERIARAAGIDYLRLDVLAGNTRAHDLYRRLGYADHLISMEKRL